MRKVWQVLFLLLLLPVTTLAFTGKVQDDSLVFNYPINDDFYAAGGEIIIKETIGGDVILAGGNIEIDAIVKADVLVLGGKVLIEQEVGDDVRVLGGEVLINDNVKGDVIVAGGTIEIASGVTIGGDLVVAGGELIINGIIKGDLLLAAEKVDFDAIVEGDAKVSVSKHLTTNGSLINIGEKAIFKGNLQYSAPESILELEEKVVGEVEFKKITNFQEWSQETIIDNKSAFGGFAVVWILYRLLFLVVFAGILFFVFEKFYSLAAANLSKQWLWSGVKWLLYLILMPVIIGMLFVSIIGLPFGFFSLFLFLFSLFFYELIGTIVFSAFFINKYLKPGAEGYKKLGIILGVALFFVLINGLDLIVALFAIGALLTTKIQVLKSFIKK